MEYYSTIKKKPNLVNYNKMDGLGRYYGKGEICLVESKTVGNRS